MRRAAAVRRRRLPRRRLVLLLALPGRSAAAASETAARGQECPRGYYRSTAIVFGCEHTHGTAHFLLAPAATTTVVTVPAGVKNFTVAATADTGIGLKLTNASNGASIVDSNSRRPGIITSRRREGSFEGMPIAFSSDDAGGTDTESLEMLGTLPAPTVLRFSSGDSSWGTVTMVYDHRGIEPCPAVPEGCELYDEAAARLEVVDWSRWAQSRFESADEAWLIRGAPHATSADGGVFWHSWPAVWFQSTNTPTKLDGEEWQPAFHWLDEDRNGEVSQSEFETGYNAVTYGGRPSIVSTVITSATATASTASIAPSTSAVPATVPTSTANHTTLPSLPVPATVPAPPHLQPSSWVDRSRWWLVALGCLLLALLATAAVLLSRPRLKRRTRGARSVRSRDSDVRLDVDEDDSPSERAEKELDESFSTSYTDACSNLDDSVQVPRPWVPRFFTPLLSPWGPVESSPPTWRRPVASAPFAARGPAWGSSPQTAVRYGPLPTRESFAPPRPQLRPAQVAPRRGQFRQAGTPGSPLLKARDASSMQRSPSMASTSLAEPTSVSFSVQPGSSWGPLKVIQASPEHLEALRNAPKVHVREKSQSFASSGTGQESFSKVDYKAHSFTTPGSTPATKGAPSSPLSTKQQAPWAAVFTPEEWSRATQLTGQAGPA